MESKIRSSGIDIIGNTPWGTHFCLFYQTKEDLIDILVPYFKAGLENNEYCMWVTSEPLNEKEAEKAIRVAMPNFDEYLLRNQIEIIPYTEWYIKNSEFESDRVLNGWVDKCNSALVNGFNGLRLTGNTFWLEKKDWNDFKDYEEEVNNVIGNFQMMAICTYSLEKCGAFELLDVIQNHQFALIRRENKWESFKSMEQIALEQKLEESEQRFKKFMDSATDGFVLFDSKLNFFDVNNVSLRMVGMSKEELIGKNILEITPYLKETGRYDKYLNVIKTGKPFSTEDVIFSQQDGMVSSHLSIRAFKVGDNLGVIFTDITERKKVDQKLKESESKLRGIMNSITDQVCILDRNLDILYINSMTEEIYGSPPLGSKCYQFFHGLDEPCSDCHVRRTFEDSEAHEKECIRIIGEESRYCWCVSNVFEIDEEERPISVVEVSRDITDRKLREEEIRLQSKIIENMSEGVFLIKLDDGTIFFTNPAFEEMFGYNPGEMIGKNVAIVNAPTDRKPEEIREEIMGILKETGEWHGEVLNVKKDGALFWCYANVSLFDHPEYGTVIISVHTDITERKKIEQELKESEEGYRTIINFLGDPMHVIDRNYNIILINETLKKWVKNLNLDTELIGKTPKEAWPFLPDWAMEEYHSIFNNGNPVVTIGSIIINNKEITTETRKIPIFKKEKVIKIITLIRDITESMEAEQKLKKSEHDLGERVKELTCLYEISKLVENPVISYEDIFNGTLNLIPPAWQLPDITTARITYNGRVYKFDNFEETEWKLSTMVNINEKPLLIEVFYLENKPFLTEEYDLIQDIGLRLKVTLEEKVAQNKLRISEEKYRMGFESSTDGIASADMEGKFLDFNNAYLEMLGYSREELLKLNFREITPQKWYKMEDDLILAQISDNKDSGIYEKEYIRKNGTVFPVEVRFWIINDDQGDPIRRWGIFRDITENKKAKEEIANLAKFPSENPYPVLRVNTNNLIYINSSGKNLLKINNDDYNIPEFLRAKIKEAVINNAITEVEVDINNRVYSFNIAPVLDSNYLNIYGMDITERKQVEHKLKEVNELKSEFLRRASHELKTPLISIKGFSDLILAIHSEQLSPDIRSKLNEINLGCERLQNIINNLLKTSRLESPELVPKIQREDLSFLLKFCVHELQSIAVARNQRIELDIHDGQYAYFEKEEIHDVISNLLTNAIKYTPPNGRIKLKTEIMGNFVTISVKDNGIGFTEEEKAKIFQQFGKIERYGQGLDLGIDGTGLGLYISKRIVESHSGEIWMESEGKNNGSTFYFTLPLNIA